MASWHPFIEGEPVETEHVIRLCGERLDSGKVLDAEEKQCYIDFFVRHAPETMVWKPMSTGWGASPFNPNNWRTLDGDPVRAEGTPIDGLEPETVGTSE